MFKVATFDPKVLSWWKSKRTKIDMDPPYQRHGRLWSTADKAYLIDSILNGFDIPKLYIADFNYGNSALNRRQLPYAIIDGKQRFEAVFDFYDGRFALNQDFRYLPNESLKLAGLSYTDLRSNYPEVAEDFDNYQLTVMAVITDQEETINELFVRLNRSKPLTGAEIRNAMVGPAPGLFREIAKHEFFKENIRFTITRAQDFNAAAKLLLFEYDNRPAETKKRSLDKFADRTKHEPKEKLELAGRRVIDVLDNMTNIFLPKDALLGAAGVLPVYYWFVRSQDEQVYPRVREFLVRFDDERRANRQQSKGHRAAARDKQLTEFDRYNRSTNDEKSHAERIRILSERFKQYLRSRRAQRPK